MKKNKIILALVFGFVFLSPTFIVKAATTINPIIATPSQKMADPALKKVSEDMIKVVLNKQAEIKKEIEIRKTEIKKKIENNTEKKTLLEAKKQVIVKRIVDKIFNNLYNQQVKLGEIDAKISAMIKANKDKSKDVSAIEAQYKIAKMVFEISKIEIFDTQSITTDQVKVATSKSVIREMVKISEDKMKMIGTEYKKLIPLLAQLEGDNSIKN